MGGGGGLLSGPQAVPPVEVCKESTRRLQGQAVLPVASHPQPSAQENSRQSGLGAQVPLTLKFDKATWPFPILNMRHGAYQHDNNYNCHDRDFT